MKLSRRIFLGTAAGGALVVAAGGSVLVPRGVGTHRAFSDAEYATLQALCDALYPASVLGVGAREILVAERVDTYVASFYGRERGLLRLLMRLVETRARVDGSGGAFSTLDEPARVSALVRWEAERTPWGLGIRAVRALTAFMFFSDPRVARAIGWGVGCVPGGVGGMPVDPYSLGITAVDGGTP